MVVGAGSVSGSWWQLLRDATEMNLRSLMGEIRRFVKSEGLFSVLHEMTLQNIVIFLKTYPSLSLSLSLSLSVTQPDCKMWYMVSEAENVFYMESNFHYEVYGKTIKAIIKIRGHSSTLLLYISRFYSNFLLSSPKRDYKSGSYLTSVTSSTYTIRWDLLERRLCKLDG